MCVNISTFFPRKPPLRSTNNRQAHPYLIKLCQPMSVSSQFPWMRFVCLLATLAWPAVGSAQGNFHANPGEYSVSGVVAGDQVHSQLSINDSGGFLVFEDNVGGIRAQALDSDLAHSGAPFQVSRSKVGYQELPQVALLKGGGAVFVWQGGVSGSQDIHA